MTQETITRINDFLTQCGVFYLATNDGDQPRLRPMGSHLDMDGKLLFTVGDFKEVYRQLLANPKCEFVAMNKDMEWLRLSGEAVMESAADSARYEAICLAEAPYMRETYNETTGYRMAFFHLENATALFVGQDDVKRPF